MSEASLEFCEHRGGQWSGSRNEEAGRAADSMRDILGHLEHAHVHRGHAKEQRGRKVEEFSRGGRVIESRQQAEQAACGKPRVNAIAESVHVEERQCQQVAIGLRDLPARHDVRGVCGQIVVRQHRAFCESCGT